MKDKFLGIVKIWQFRLAALRLKGMPQTLVFQASGMHCAACAALIRQRLRKVDGVSSVTVSQSGVVQLEVEGDGPPLTVLNQSLEADGYKLSPSTFKTEPSKENALDPEQIVGTLFLAFLLFAFLQKSGLMHQGGVSLGMNGLMSAFGLGILAGFSTCMAVTGSLALAMGKRSTQIRNPGGLSSSMGWFMVGRVLAYGLSGFALGELGKVLMPGPTMNGLIALGTGLLMMVLGAKSLGIWRSGPNSRNGNAFLQTLLDRCIDGKHLLHSMGLGGLTVLLPCGFTQALQLWALAYGDGVAGGIYLAAFCFGTLPALGLFAALGGIRHQRFQGSIGAFAAAVMVLFGLNTAGGGLGLLGLDPRPRLSALISPQGSPTPAILRDGQQEIRLQILGLQYSPSQFLVNPQMPVALTIDSQNAAGCARVFQAPSLGIDQLLSAEKPTTVRFTPEKEGRFPIHCGMAMTTPGAAILVKKGAVPANLPPPSSPPPLEPSFFQSYLEDDPVNSQVKQFLPPTTPMEPGCFPGQPTCPGQARKVRLLFGGKFNPSLIQVEKNIPVGLTIQSPFTPTECLAEVAIPGLGLIAPMNKGITRIRFTPKKAGKFLITCGMQMIEFGYLEVSG